MARSRVLGRAVVAAALVAAASSVVGASAAPAESVTRRVVDVGKLHLYVFQNARRSAHSPDGTVPWIVYVHPGAWVAGSPDEAEAQKFCDHEAQLGLTCLSVDYPLAPKSIWPAQADAVTTQLAWIRAHGSTFHLDPAEGFVVGSSSGALMAGVSGLGDGKLAGIGIFDGAVDVPQTIRTASLAALRKNASALVGGRGPDDPLTQSARVIAHVDPDTVRVPVLIVQNAGDPVVDAAMGTTLAAGLTTDGFPVTYDLLPDNRHSTDNDPVPLGAADAWIQGRLSVIRATATSPRATDFPTPTSTDLTVSAVSAVLGQRLTARVHVTGYGGRADGRVSLLDAGRSVATGSVTDGNGTVAFRPTAVGRHAYTVVYLGTRSFAPSTSAQGVVTIRARPTVSLALAPRTADVGRQVRVTIRVRGSVGGATGVVSLTDRGVVVAAATLRRGSASTVITPTRAGTTYYVARYDGSTRYIAVSSPRAGLRAVAATAHR